MEIVNQGWFGIVAGTAIAVLLGYYFYAIARREPKGCFAMRSLGVIGLRGASDIHDHISVQFRGEAVPRLSVATVAFWNGGTAVLDGSAVVARDVLRLEIAGEGRILETSIVRNPDPQCACSVEVSDAAPNAVAIRFEYLNVRQGFVFRVLHTAPPESASFRGSLKGAIVENEAGSIAVRSLTRRLDRGVFWSMSGLVLLFTTAAICIFVCAIIFGMANVKVAIEPMRPYAFGLLVLFLVITLFGSLVADLPERALANKIPKNLLPR